MKYHKKAKMYTTCLFVRGVKTGNIMVKMLSLPLRTFYNQFSKLANMFSTHAH